MIAYYIVVFVFGLLTGSFLNECISRIPQGESVVWSALHCRCCGARLKLSDIVPVLSYTFFRTRSRCCKERIPVRYLLVDLTAAITFLLLFMKYRMTIDFVVYAYLMSVLIVVAYIDIDHRIIPDELVAAGLVGGIVLFLYNLFKTMDIYGDSKWWNPLLGAVSSSGILFLIALVSSLIYKSDDAMGMGDIKIFVPIGLFLGWRICLLALILSIIAGGFCGVFLIASGKKRKRDTIPFGPFIVFSTFIAVMWGWDIIRWYITRL